nr:IclR family transcriptional regulator [Nitrosomonas nitrosa]
MDTSGSGRKKHRTRSSAGAASAPPYPVESVDSALKILRMLFSAKELRVSEAAERLGVAQSTAHRLLSMLVHHGFARQDERRGVYRTGRMILEMGFAAMRDMEIRDHARPVLEELRDKVDETVHLGVPYGVEVFYVEGVESRRPLRIGSRVGVFLPAHSVALGKALLATLSTEELRRLYPDGRLSAMTDRTVTTLAELERHLARIRSMGFARSRGESDDGVGSIAVAVLDRHGVARAAISIGAPVTRITPEREAHWVDAAKAAAAELRVRLWGGPGLDRGASRAA